MRGPLLDLKHSSFEGEEGQPITIFICSLRQTHVVSYGELQKHPRRKVRSIRRTSLRNGGRKTSAEARLTDCGWPFLMSSAKIAFVMKSSLASELAWATLLALTEEDGKRGKENAALTSRSVAVNGKIRQLSSFATFTGRDTTADQPGIYSSSTIQMSKSHDTTDRVSP